MNMLPADLLHHITQHRKTAYHIQRFRHRPCAIRPKASATTIALRFIISLPHQFAPADQQSAARAKNSEIKTARWRSARWRARREDWPPRETQTQPAQSAPESAASSRMPGSVRAQQRAATAGSIITPTAISVPST